VVILGQKEEKTAKVEEGQQLQEGKTGKNDAESFSLF